MSMPASSIRAVVFDLDGLMFNTEDLYQQVGSEILRRRGHRFESDLLDRMMGRPGQIALQIMIDWHHLPDTVEQLQEETDTIFDEILDDGLQPMPGLLKLLGALEEEGFPKAIATSSRRQFVDQILPRYDLEARFDFVLTSENVKNGKPDPEIYLLAAERLTLLPDQIMVLEDSENGCRAAMAAGTFAVAVPGGQSRTHNFEGAAIVADGLVDRRIYDALEIDESSC